MNGAFRRSAKLPMNDPQPAADVALPGFDTPSTYWIDVTYLVEMALEAEPPPRSERTDP